jgi:hypothetical protein
VKECVGSRGFIPPILSLCSTWRSVTNFTLWEKTLRIHLMGGYVGPKRGLYDLEKRKNLFFLPGIFNRLPVSSCL